jgi:hypothetical protein
VINRDPRDVHDELERGEVTPAVTLDEKEDITQVQDLAVAEKRMGDGDEVSGSILLPSTRVGEPRPTTNEHEGILTEWREGPHQIIERRTGSGGEVRIFLLHSSASGGY